MHACAGCLADFLPPAILFHLPVLHRHWGSPFHYGILFGKLTRGPPVQYSGISRVCCMLELDMAAAEITLVFETEL